MEQQSVEVEAPDFAWIAALKAEGNYFAAAETAGRLFANAPASQHFLLVCEWEDVAFALRPAALAVPHPSVKDVLPALRRVLESGLLDDAQRAIVMARIARQETWPDPSQPVPIAREAVVVARASGSPEALIEALAALHGTLDSPRYIRERLTLSGELTTLADGQRSPLLRAMAHWRAVIDALIEADSAGFDYHLSRLSMAADETGDRFWKTASLACVATHELLQGNYSRAEALLPQILETAGSAVAGMSMPSVTSIGLLARYQRGRGSMEGLSRMFQGVRSAHVAFRVAMAYYLATSGRAVEAAAEIGPVALDEIPDDAGRVPCLCMAAELASLHFKDAQMAETAYSLLAPFDGQMSVTGDALSCWGPVSLYRGMAARFLGSPQAKSHFEDARQTAASMRARPWLARAELLLGLELLATDQASANPHLEGALTIAEKLELRSVAAEARAGLRPPAPARATPSNTRLTAREREILGLASHGLTSAEVADRLVLSHRTVEKHLQNAYSKIGARNRAEGISWAIANGLAKDA